VTPPGPSPYSASNAHEPDITTLRRDPAPEGERLAQRFITELEAQTRPLRARWPDQRQRLAVELLNEISDTLDDAARQARAARAKGIRAGTRRRSDVGGSPARR
jgi:hypothetical protein